MIGCGRRYGQKLTEGNPNISTNVCCFCFQPPTRYSDVRSSSLLVYSEVRQRGVYGGKDLAGLGGVNLSPT